MTPTVVSRRKIVISPIETVGGKKDKTPKKTQKDIYQHKYTNENMYSINSNAPLIQNYSRIFN
jgi:hypothetical protein